MTCRRRRCALVGAALLVPLCSSLALAAYVVTPGFLYTPSDQTARQFTPTLQLVGTGGPSNFLGSSGAGITHDGLFVYEAYRQNIAGLPDGAHLLALSNAGAIAHELYLTNQGLNRASGIGVDSSGRIYASAADGLHQISADFSSNTVLPIAFGRASGVAVAPNDFLYVTDQNTNNIKVLNAARQLVGTIPTGPVPSGATIGPDGALYYTDTPAQTPDGFIGRLVRVDLATQQQTVIFDDLAFPMDVEFAPDGSYYLATRSGREIDHYASNNVFINSFSDGVISDQLAFYAPEPASSAVLITVATAAAMQRRRHRR